MNLVLSILITIFPVAIVILIAILDYFKNDTRTNINKKFKKYLIYLLVISLFVSIYSTINAYNDEQKTKTENKISTQTIDSLTRLNNNLSLSNSNKLDSTLIRLEDIIGGSTLLLDKLRKVTSAISDVNKNIVTIHPKLELIPA